MHEKLEDAAGQLNYQIRQLNCLLETTAMIRHQDDLDRISRDLKTAVDVVIHVIGDIQWANCRDNDNDDEI